MLPRFRQRSASCLKPSNPVLLVVLAGLLLLLAFVCLNLSASSAGASHANRPWSTSAATAHSPASFSPPLRLPNVDGIVLHIVFFAHVLPMDMLDRSLFLIREQLSELVDFGLAAHSLASGGSLCVVLNYNGSGADVRHVEELGLASALVSRIAPRARVSMFAENLHEYHGIKKAWDVAQHIPQAAASRHIVLYFHSKGLVFSRQADRNRSSGNVGLTRLVIKPWRQVLARFGSEPRLNKAGYAASRTGFIWMNWWYVRASYLQKVPVPKVLHPRYRIQFETWLGTTTDADLGKNPMYMNSELMSFTDASDCLSLCYGNVSAELGLWFGMGPPRDLGMCQEGKAEQDKLWFG
jgi:hypothetical protein